MVETSECGTASEVGSVKRAEISTDQYDIKNKKLIMLIIILL